MAGGGAYIFGAAMIVVDRSETTWPQVTLASLMLSGVQALSNPFRDTFHQQCPEISVAACARPVFLTNTLFVSNSADYGGGVYAGRVSIHGGRYQQFGQRRGGGHTPRPTR
jgi:predicted outer membrane repeat protein